MDILMLILALERGALASAVLVEVNEACRWRASGKIGPRSLAAGLPQSDLVRKDVGGLEDGVASSLLVFWR